MKTIDVYPVNQDDIQKRASFEEAPLSVREEMFERDMDRAKLENQKNFKELAIIENNPEKKELYNKVYSVSQKISEEGGLALVVGGFTRDCVLRSLGYEIESKDVDIEVYGIEMSNLEKILSEFGTPNIVGKSFGVLKLRDLDISLPRTESKAGKGRREFDIKSDPKLFLREATRRRDLTIGSLALNPLTGEIIDPFGGIDDILNKRLRTLDVDKFKEDPLRVLRVMQFAGRFDFEVEEKTKQACLDLVRDGDVEKMSIERIWDEWEKFLVKSKKPSTGLKIACEMEIVHLYPELENLLSCEQEKDWHPEGSVWTHTLMVLDEAQKISEREKLSEHDRLVLMLSALCHDFGKPETTEKKEKDGVERITSHGHEEAGVEPTKKFLAAIGAPKEIIAEVSPLVSHHLFPAQYKEDVTDSAVRRLAKKLAPATIKLLVLLSEADSHGRGYWTDQTGHIPESKEWTGFESGQKLLSHAERLADVSATSSKIVKYITGKKLIELGLDKSSGQKFGLILGKLEKAQEDNLVKNPDDLRLAKLLVFLNNSEKNNLAGIELLTGENLSKEEMMKEIEDRFFENGTHDMGTLLMTLILKGEKIPPILERNKVAILTAHKHGPAWFKHFDKEFYETSWKSFYGQFEVDEEKQKELAGLDFEEQLKIGLDLINNPDQNSIDKYKESFDIKPEKSSGKIAFYNTNLYPFEAGMMDGFEIMVQFIPEKNRLCVSVMNVDPEEVKRIDQEIRQKFPEFKNAKKVGYLFASNKEGDDNVFTEKDAERVYSELSDIFTL